MAHQVKADNRAGDPSADVVQREVRARLVRVLAGCVAAAAMVVFAATWFRPPAESISAGPVRAERESQADLRPQDEPTAAAAQRPPRRAAVILPTLATPASAEQLQREAEGVAAELRRRYPDLPEALHVAALAHAQLRQTAEAEKLWRRCVELEPRSDQHRINLAAVAMERGDSQQAVQTLQEAVDAGSTSPDVLHHLGVALTNVGRCEEAEQVLRRALAADSRSAAHWLVLGQAQLKLGKAAAAEASLRRAIDLGLRSPAAYFALANACARQGKDEEAAKSREQFTSLTAEQPLSAQERFQVLSTAEARRTAVAVLVEAATVHSWQRETLEAERLLLRALALDPINAPACRALVEIYQQAGILAEQRAVWQRLVEIEPHSFVNYLHLARTSADMGEPEAAEAALKLALAIQPQAIDGYVTLAEFYLESGQAEKARWFAQEAVRRQPSAEGYELLASTCRAMSDQAAAGAALAEAQKLKTTATKP